MLSEWITVEIGGYRRYIPENKLDQVKKDAQNYIEQYVAMGIPREQAEEAYKVVIVNNKEPL